MSRPFFSFGGDFFIPGAALFLSAPPLFFPRRPPLPVSDHSCAFLLISRRLSGDFRAFSPIPRQL